MRSSRRLLRTIKTDLCSVLVCVIILVLCEDVLGLNGNHVCNVKQKYNVTKRVKYRAPMSVRTYEWCFAMPPRCSRWTTEMKDLTRLETEERVAEVAVCCPGYKMKDVACVPVCPNGRTGPGCTEECPDNMWGPNCVNNCSKCFHGICSPITGECGCEDGWKGESCEISMPVTTSTTVKEQLLTTKLTSSATSSTASFSTTESKSSSIETITTPATRTTATLTTLPTISATSEVYTDITGNTLTTKEATTSETKGNAVSKTESNFETIHSTEVTPTIDTKIIIETTTTAPVIIQTVTATTRDVSTTMRPEFIPKTTQQTTKFRPKEIWIKPAQKGESLIEKVNVHEAHQRPKTTSPITTPRTIIVSIIPTSMTYSTFKKISLTTASLAAQNISKSLNMTTQRKKLSNHSLSTPMSFNTIKLMSTSQSQFRNKSTTSTVNPLLLKNINEQKSYTYSITKPPYASTTRTKLSTANSMSTTKKVNTNLYANNKTLTTNMTMTRNTSPIQVSTVTKTMVTTPMPTKKTKASTRATKLSISTTQHPSISNQSITVERNRSFERSQAKPKQRSTLIKTGTNRDLTKLNVNTTTERVTERMTTLEDELFHILTEPEHITAVVGEKNEDRNSVDLVSVVSIAGGVMMAVITVAVVIVMVERCRRPRYQEVRKENDIRMKVVIGNDVPPPYSRSIFHTPLPDPPASEKCHYQPISTLDRNLKQFMRPVVVQGISPIMIENFRDIFECHYDHLPRRSYDNDRIMQPKRVVAPPSGNDVQPRSALVDDTTIEALKCEAKFDVIDNTTSEPLYAEIPAWRPPSEHAIAVVNLNGEAITEL